MKENTPHAIQSQPIGADPNAIPWECSCSPRRVFDRRFCAYCPECGSSPEEQTPSLFPPEELAQILDVGFALGWCARAEAERLTPSLEEAPHGKH